MEASSRLGFQQLVVVGAARWKEELWDESAGSGEELLEELLAVGGAGSLGRGGAGVEAPGCGAGAGGVG